MLNHVSPIHPGDVLRTVLTDHVITQDTLAEALRVSRFSVNQIVNGRRNITPEMALRLSRALSSSPEFWLNLQRQYDLCLAVQAVDAGPAIDVLIHRKS
jgi:addiction module HigA family antidote